MLWAPRVLPFAQQWAQALDDVVVEERPHSDEAFAAYLAWYLPRTRSRVVVVPQDPHGAPARVTDTYPVSRDQNFAIAVCLSNLIMLSFISYDFILNHNLDNYVFGRPRL